MLKLYLDTMVLDMLLEVPSLEILMALDLLQMELYIGMRPVFQLLQVALRSILLKEVNLRYYKLQIQ